MSTPHDKQAACICCKYCILYVVFIPDGLSENIDLLLLEFISRFYLNVILHFVQ